MGYCSGRRILATERLSDDVRASLERATVQYASTIVDAPDCLSYLAERGIHLEPDLPEEYGNPYRLGYVATAAMPEHEGKIGCLSIPYLVRDGGPVGMKFRALDGSTPKYKAHSGMGTRLFGVKALQEDTDIIAVTEGELDAIVASSTGLPAVAVPGVNAWRDEWVYLFEGYARVLVFGDGDDPGRDFAARLARAIPNARAVNMPEGYDVSSLVVECGVNAFKNRAGV